ncbi:MAG: MurR/RpiR family transcriptional regulator [Sediminimonas qiaohouensis]|uniref:MurR/RpiR family transcriptional regulator n=1 Tax=Sediminimonas qiaohouensis TaxID=552061 RepID=A0A7C9HAM5_9RHOB|nr:MurR/RpiR family transcriptional regulator [Sediminimonas qiaohouensis]MTJ04210.1 MurR/RpiR family transcriptional regulator [Sediminimonas qiaohouensis]
MTGSRKRPPAQAATNAPEAPDTVAGLRDLLLRIARGESDIVLGPKARTALGRILDLQGDPALLSITALANRLEVNPSTITRLARTLGYSGFAAFQEVLLSASMAAPGAFYTRQARAALESGDAPSRAGATQLCRENQANIDRFVEGFDSAAFDEAVRLITTAPRVAVHGIRQFHAVASFLVYGLRMIRSDVNLLDGNSLGTAEGVAALAPGDTLVTTSCAPYSAQVVEVARAAADKGVAVVALTDTVSSPLVDTSRAALGIPHASSFISNSLTSFIAVSECVINGCAAVMPDAAKDALAERDRMIKRLSIEL